MYHSNGSLHLSRGFLHIITRYNSRLRLRPCDVSDGDLLTLGDEPCSPARPSTCPGWPRRREHRPHGRCNGCQRWGRSCAACVGRCCQRAAALSRRYGCWHLRRGGLEAAGLTSAADGGRCELRRCARPPGANTPLVCAGGFARCARIQTSTQQARVRGHSLFHGPPPLPRAPPVGIVSTFAASALTACGVLHRCDAHPSLSPCTRQLAQRLWVPASRAA